MSLWSTITLPFHCICAYKNVDDIFTHNTTDPKRYSIKTKGKWGKYTRCWWLMCARISCVYVVASNVLFLWPFYVHKYYDLVCKSGIIKNHLHMYIIYETVEGELDIAWNEEENSASFKSFLRFCWYLNYRVDRCTWMRVLSCKSRKTCNYHNN